MNILLIAYYYPPINSGGSLRPLKMARYLERHGHRVSVLTHTYEGKPNKETGVIRVFDPGYNRGRMTRSRKVLWLLRRIWVEIYCRLGRYRSIYSRWEMNVLSQKQQILEEANPDLIISSYPPAETLAIGLSIAEAEKIPLVVDFRDGLLFESIEEKLIERLPAVARRYAALEERVAAEAAAIFTVADPLTRYFREKYGLEKIKTVASGFDPGDFSGQANEIPLSDDAYNIVHTGRFALSDSGITADGFFKAVRDVVSQYPDMTERLCIHLAGELSAGEQNRIADLVEKGVVKYHGLLERSQALALQQRADLLLIITQPTRTSAVSAKIFEYLFVRRPILALTHNTEAARIVNETRSGWVVHPHDTDRIAALLRRLLADPAAGNDLPLTMENIEPYSWENQASYLLDLINEVHQTYTREGQT